MLIPQGIGWTHKTISLLMLKIEIYKVHKSRNSNETNKLKDNNKPKKKKKNFKPTRLIKQDKQ